MTRFLSKNIPTLFFTLFIVIAMIVMTLIIWVESNELFNANPIIQKGVIRLDDKLLSDYNVLGLRGEAEFYWKRLLTPDDFKNISNLEKEYITIPGIWNDKIINNQPIKGEGFATYRINGEIPKGKRYGLKIDELDCAYSIWVNNVKYNTGIVGTSDDEEIPSWRRNVIYFNDDDGKLEIVLQVSNFNHRKGGAEDPIFIGYSNHILDKTEQQKAIGFFFIGVFLILFFYHIGMYLFRPVEKSALYFALLCLAVLFRLMTTGEKLFYEILPYVNWQIGIRIEYISYTIAVPFAFEFMRSIYPQVYKLIFSKTIWICGIICTLFVLLTPSTIFSYSPILYQWIAIGTAMLIMWGLIKAIINKYEYAWILAFGYLFFFLVVINDMLYYNKLINTSFLMPLGLFVFVFSNSFVLSRKFSITHNKLEALSKELDKYNLELEKTISVRTEKINQQKIELEESNKQLEELNIFKENLTQMIVHDLKNPLNTIIGMSHLKDIPEKDKLIEYSGKEMLNLVMNILDVGKMKSTTIEISAHQTPIKDVITSAINDVIFIANKRDNKIIFDESISHEAFLDAHYIQRVIVNLLTNAIKFSPPSTEIRIECEYQNQFLKIQIIDQGPGISEDAKNQIFNYYFSGDKQHETLRSTGLGLAFCKMAIQAHEGDIFVENNANGIGSNFTILLPALDTKQSGTTLSFDLQSELSSDNESQKIINHEMEVLSTLKVYEISKIMNTLQKIKALKIKSIDTLLQNIEAAVQNCKDEEFREIIRTYINLNQTK